MSTEKDVATPEAALEGARSILVERFAENAELLGSLRETYWERGSLTSKVRDGKTTEGAKFADYFDFAEPLTKLPSHRILALFRGEKEEILDLRMEEDKESAEPGYVSRYEGRTALAFGIVDQGRPGDKWLLDTVRWAWRTKLRFSIELDMKMRLWQLAEDEAVKVFAGNLRDLLLAAPAGARPTLGLDPGFRTGVKVAVVDATGKVVATDTIYPHEPKRQWDESLATLARLCRVHRVELIAIGNGTASRETDKLAAELVSKHPDLTLTKIMVSEAGASVYSASAFASQELPDLDVSLRGAVSIARRLQDPLAELVKIDPKSIGVGQYQHDLAEYKLSRSLDAVVEDCVNAVGVDLNTASAPLLARVSGLGDWVAQNIVTHRDANGPFKTRKALTKVSGLGPKTFEQAAGFLRIPNGDDPLDASGVHPEAYPVVRRILEATKSDIKVVIGNGGVLKKLKPAKLHGREIRRADGEGHPERAGKARPRPAPRVQDRHLHGGRGEDRRSEAWHDAGRSRHQRGGLRRLRRCRRAPGRPRAHLGARRHLREGSAHRREAGRHREGEGARGGHAAQAHLAHHAHERPGREAAGRAAGRQPGCLPEASRPGREEAGRPGLFRRRARRCPAPGRHGQGRPEVAAIGALVAAPEVI